MSVRTARPAAALLAAATLTTFITAATPARAAVPQRAVPTAGFSETAVTPPWAIIERTRAGYRYTAGLHDSDLTITRVERGLRFADRNTVDLKSVPNSCRRRPVEDGIAAVCRVRDDVTATNPMKVEVWPRLGDDAVDGSRLSAAFEMSVLADAGRDVVRTGAGNDFVNGAQDRDRVRGGAGRDWIRTGIGNDSIVGNAGNDQLVGVEGHDTIRGGDGNDRVGGGPGDDRLYAEGGADHVLCGSGTDRAYVDSADTTSQDCESVDRS